MIDFEAKKNNLVNKLFLDLQIKYANEMDEAREVQHSFREIFKQTDSEYIKVQSLYVKPKSDVKSTIPVINLAQSIKDLLARKKKETYSTAFSFFTKKFNRKEQTEIIEKIAIVEAYKKQIDFLWDQEKQIFPSEFFTREETTNEDLNQKNYFPDIFKNISSFEMFSELQKLTVNEKTIVADYSFIFHKLKDKNILAINSHVTEPLFIEFLNTNYNTNIAMRKLPYRDPASKKKMYATVLSKFKDQIMSEPKKVR